MKSISALRKSLPVSQRAFARKAGISYKSLQLVEGAHHDVRLSTLTKIARAFHYPQNVFKSYLSKFFELPHDSITMISRQMVETRSPDWKILLFNFVDAFRKKRESKYICEPPSEGLSPPIKAVLASTTESLCGELGLDVPWWCASVEPLPEPYFVAGVENLKALSLVEAPAHFRKRNVFVLQNFLDRV